MDGTGGLLLSPAGYDDPDTQALVAQVQEEYVLLYGEPDDSPLADGGFDPPRGAFFVGRADGAPVAMGGWRRRPDVKALGRTETAELKRMYVVPTAHRRGFARVMLTHLEETARAAGADLMVLETGTMQPEGIALYEAAGYELIELFGHYSWSPLARCYGKRL